MPDEDKSKSMLGFLRKLVPPGALEKWAARIAAPRTAGGAGAVGVAGGQSGSPDLEDPGPGEDGENPCCEGQVHIAYRGVSDDRLYLVHNRKWRETRFFKPHGLRVFCAKCRRRIV